MHDRTKIKTYNISSTFLIFINFELNPFQNVDIANWMNARATAQPEGIQMLSFYSDISKFLWMFYGYGYILPLNENRTFHEHFKKNTKIAQFLKQMDMNRFYQETHPEFYVITCTYRNRRCNYWRRAPHRLWRYRFYRFPLKL